MRTLLVTLLIALMLSTLAGIASSTEIRGQVFENRDQAIWDYSNFPGFYYDVDDGVGTEKLTFSFGDSRKLSGEAPYGAEYITTVKPIEFESGHFGSYDVIGFMGEKYFAGYTNGVLYNYSEDENILSNNKITKILIDSDSEYTINSGDSIPLLEGYNLSIKSIDVDGNKIFLELLKHGTVIDSKVIQSTIGNASLDDQTYVFKQDFGNSKDVVLIAVHFGNTFLGSNQSITTINGIWQISENFLELKDDAKFGKMTVMDVNFNTIRLVNKDSAMTLSPNKEIGLMSGIGIKVADNETLRYYIFGEEF